MNVFNYEIIEHIIPGFFKLKGIPQRVHTMTKCTISNVNQITNKPKKLWSTDLTHLNGVIA